MNKFTHFLKIAVILLGAFSLASAAQAQGKRNSAGEEFFIVSSVDQPKSQVLLKRPTEVTLLMKVDASTKYFDEKDKSLKLTDLRAGDTVWVVSSGSEGTEPVARSIHRGPMTVEELHRYFLDYPVIK